MFKCCCSGNHNVRFWEASIETFINGCAPIARMAEPDCLRSRQRGDHLVDVAVVF